MAKRYLGTLREDERAHLLALTKKGTLAARNLTRAHILLQADAGEMSGRDHQLAVHHRQGTTHTQAPLPIIGSVVNH